MQPITRCPHSGAPTTLPELAARYGMPLSVVQMRHAQGKVGTQLVSAPSRQAQINAEAARAHNIRAAAQSPLACPMRRLGDAHQRQQVAP